MSAEDKNVILHLDATEEGRKSESAEAQVRVEAVDRGEDGVVGSRQEHGDATTGGVPAVGEAVLGKASEWPSTSKPSLNLGNPTDSKEISRELERPEENDAVLKDEGRGEGSGDVGGDGSNIGEEGTVRNAEGCEAPRREEATRAPNNTQERPTDVQHFLCYICGTFFDVQQEYQQHVLYHELMRVAHHIWKLEPSFRLEVTSSFDQAPLLLHAPYIHVVRRKRSATEWGSSDEPEEKRRDMAHVSFVDIEGDDSNFSADSDDDIIPIDDATLVEIKEERTTAQAVVDQQLERPDDRFVTIRRRKEKVQGDGADLDDDEQVDEMDEDEDEDEATLVWTEELGRIRETVLNARIFDIPIKEARDLVSAINMSRDWKDGWIVIEEREEEGRIRVNDVLFESLRIIEDEAKKRLEELVSSVALNIDGTGRLDDIDELEQPRFISSLGERISEDGWDAEEVQFEDLSDIRNDSPLDRSDDVPQFDGIDFGARSEGEADGDDDDVDAAVPAAPATHSINLEEDGIGEELKKKLPDMLKDADFESCSTDKCITPNALFSGLMQEASAKNAKDARIGVLPPSVLKDWQDGKKMKKAEIDEMMFNRDPQLVLIPIYQSMRDFETVKIEHWVVGNYDVFGCSVTIYDSIEATKVEKEAIIGLLKELMVEWLGEDESSCLKYRFARKDRVEKQEDRQLNKASSGLFALVHARRLAQLERDCSSRGRAPMDVDHERRRLMEIMKAVGPDFKKMAQSSTAIGSQKQQQQKNQRKRKIPALTTPEFIKARRDNTETREKIRRCCSELKRRC